jgi:hypothetical protein
MFARDYYLFLLLLPPPPLVMRLQMAFGMKTHRTHKTLPLFLSHRNEQPNRKLILMGKFYGP